MGQIKHDYWPTSPGAYSFTKNTRGRKQDKKSMVSMNLGFCFFKIELTANEIPCVYTCIHTSVQKVCRK